MQATSQRAAIPPPWERGQAREWDNPETWFAGHLEPRTTPFKGRTRYEIFASKLPPRKKPRISTLPPLPPMNDNGRKGDFNKPIINGAYIEPWQKPKKERTGVIQAGTYHNPMDSEEINKGYYDKFDPNKRNLRKANVSR